MVIGKVGNYDPHYVNALSVIGKSTNFINERVRLKVFKNKRMDFYSHVNISQNIQN